MTGGFIDKFSDASAGYRRSRPFYPPALFEALAALAPGRDLAWDVGTGNGQAAGALASHFARVHATDPSPQQIAEAVPAERVTYRVELAEQVSLPDGCADLVLAAQSLHWFDRARFYAEAKRVLKPGGVLAATGYDWIYVSPDIDQTINRHLMPMLERYWAPQNAILWSGYRGIDFPGEEVRLGAFAIHLDWSFEQVRAYILSWSAARACLAAEGEGALAAPLAALAELWGDAPRHVIMPLHLRVARLGA